MKKFLTVLSIFFIVSCFVPAVSANNGVIYVSPKGSDEYGDGSINLPYQTLSKAVTASRNFKGNKRIRLREGKYSFSSPVNLNSDDSNLTIENYPNEHVEFTGGTAIPFSAFSKVTDEEVLSRIIAKKGRETVMQVYMPDVGITEYGNMNTIGFVYTSGSGYSPTLTYNDTYMTYAAYPNNRYLYTNTIIRDGRENAQSNKLSEVELTISNFDRMEKWRNAEDPWALGFLKHDWADCSAPAKFNENSIITYVANGSSYYAVPNRRIKFYNLLEELDVPGEFYLNRSTGYLYIIPPEGIDSTDELVYTTCSSNALVLRSCSNVTIQGIAIKHTRVNGIVASNCKGLTIDNCELSGTGNWAITASYCNDTTIKNCNIHDLSGGGIYLYAGNRSKLTAGNSVIENCKIQRFMNYRKTYSPAISLEGVGNKISHCEISDAPHMGVGFGGNDLVMEYCNIYNVCNDTADCGAIYMGRDWTMRGCEINYNYFHDIRSITTTTGMNVQAVYLDDAFSSAAVFGNTFYNCSSVALYGGGRYNTFENNVIIDCQKPFVFDARCTTWMDCGEGSTIRNRLYSMPYKSAVWKNAYPELEGILDDDPQLPKHNIISGNISYNTPDYELSPYVSEYGTVKDNFTIKTTNVFSDYKNGDFTVKSDSEIHSLLPSFKPTNFNSIGIYDYEYDNRASVPKIDNLCITGDFTPGSTLTLDYDYSCNGFSEANSKIVWYKKSAGYFTNVIGEKSKSLKTNPNECGIQYYAEITPVNCEGIFGKKVTSEIITINRPPVASIISLDKKGTDVVLNNDSQMTIPINVFTPSYINENGFKIMKNLQVQKVSLAPKGTEIISSESLIMCADTLEPIKIHTKE